MVDVWAVIKDPGGTNNLLPVAQELRNRHKDVVLIPNGKAVKLLENSGVKNFLRYESAKELFWGTSEFDKPQVILTSMCSDGGIGRNIIPLFRKHYPRRPIIALQDFWGARLLTDWVNKKYRPNYICVNDTVGADTVGRAWPDFNSGQVRALGYPALDEYAEFDVAAARQKVHAQLGLTTETRPIVLYIGQLKLAGQVLGELVAALNDIRKDVVLIPRRHPRMSDDAPEEETPWQKALLKFQGTIVDSSEFRKAEDLIPAVTVSAGMFSTVQNHAAVLGQPTIAILYPGIGMERWHEATGFLPNGEPLIPEFPLVTLGCSTKAANRDELCSQLLQSFDGRLRRKLEPAQRETFQPDGHNAERVADIVCEHLF